MRRNDHRHHPEHRGSRPRGHIAVGSRLIATTLVVGLATFAAPLLPAVSASAAASTLAWILREVLLAKLKDPAATKGDFFGSSVAVSGETAIVGASGTRSSVGVAYIYEKGTSGWPTTPTAKLKDPEAISDDMFGFSVALSATTAVVGAYGYASADGAAYIYEKGPSGWPTTPTATLLDPKATEGDLFGTPVAVSGETVIVGASGTRSSVGVAYIYEKGVSGWPATPTAKLKDPRATRGDFFGSSVAVSGKTAVVGASGVNDYAGAAYVYVKGTSGWPTTPTASLDDPGATDFDSFAASVAVYGSTAFVGASGTNSYMGVTYIYVKGTSGWPATPTATLSDPAATVGDDFGTSVAVSGTAAVISAPYGNSEVGVAYIYEKGASGWPATPTATVKDPKANADDDFGLSVALSGKTAAVGALGTSSSTGATYIYKSFARD